MSEIQIGLIPSPELPTLLAHDLANELPALFSQMISGKIHWRFEVFTDPLIGAAENVKDLMKETADIKNEKKWHYALCLTDLPLYDGKEVILADADFKQGVAQLSVPAFGALPIRHRIRKVVLQIVEELYEEGLEKRNANTNASRGENDLARSVKGSIRRQFPLLSIRRIHSSPIGKEMDLHFIIRPRLYGKIQMLLGMTYANRPWAIMPSFKPIVAVAFATGAYGLIFPTLWTISASFGIPRFIGLMVAAIFSIVAWIIVSHHLWEKPMKKNNKSIRKLYNRATVLTLTVAVMFYYAVLYILFLLTVLLFVPPDMFQSLANLKEHVHFGNYAMLAWLATSIATLAGSIGASLENEELVRNIMYGYRQRIRYEKMQQHHNEREDD